MIHACAASAGAARRIGVICLGALRRHTRLALLLVCVGAVVIMGAAIPVVVAFQHVYFDRSGLPDLDSFARFEFPGIGHVYDSKGHSLIELAHEYRLIARYEDIPPIVRDAILAVEDKRFFSHNGVEYWSFPRVVAKVRLHTLVARLFRSGGDENATAPAIFPQGGSTITQQLVRGQFLKGVTSQENSHHLRRLGRLSRMLSYGFGPRNANMMARKLEEIRLSLWVEHEMTRRFGSKRRAKEEILARYASSVYMGNGQYGFASAATYYFGRALATFTAADADKAALLAGIAKSPRDYAPSAFDPAKVLRRRNQTLALMAANRFLTVDQVASATERPIPAPTRRPAVLIEAPAVVSHVLEELRLRSSGGIEDLLQGRIQVYSTVDARMQHIVNEALERGLAAYEKRHVRARGLIQGSVVVLNNRDASVLAEAGGRRSYNGRSASYSDFNRATASLRQPGSVMKPIVYLAAFRSGAFNLESLVPDEPVSVRDGIGGEKWISNYDGQFKGPIPIRQALAESRNAVAVWITQQIGIDDVLRMSRALGVVTPLQRNTATALGASEMTLLELANAYRTIASGLAATPHVVQSIETRWGDAAADVRPHQPTRAPVSHAALSLIQEGLRGVVRMPSGTAHSLANSVRFPIAVMGKTGTTNEFRDALFIGSTYGAQGITVAVRIGFDDNRSLGPRETGGRVALPVFRDVMLGAYRDRIVGRAPAFPVEIEERIRVYLEAAAAGVATTSESPVVLSYPAGSQEAEWLLRQGQSVSPEATRPSSAAGPAAAMSLAGAAAAQTVADVERVEHARLAAMARGDYDTMVGFLADDFIVTSNAGTTSRRDYLAQFGRQRPPLSSVHDNVRIRVSGDKAVITGRSTRTMIVNGREHTSVAHYTHVYVLESGAWRLSVIDTVPTPIR